MRNDRSIVIIYIINRFTLMMKTWKVKFDFYMNEIEVKSIFPNICMFLNCIIVATVIIVVKIEKMRFISTLNLIFLNMKIKRDGIEDVKRRRILVKI